MATIGTESMYASAMGVTRLVAPGPLVAMQTPTRPVACAYPSAAWPAPCSWRTRMWRTVVESMSGSYAGRIAPPGIPKTVSTPSSSSARMSAWAPVTSGCTSVMIVVASSESTGPGLGNEKPPGPDGHVGVARWLPLAASRRAYEVREFGAASDQTLSYAGLNCQAGGTLVSGFRRPGPRRVLESAGDGAGRGRADELRVFGKRA